MLSEKIFIAGPLHTLTKKIQECICKWLARNGNESICENYGHCWEMDVATMSKSGTLTEFEVKVSRADFLADKKKITKFQYYENKNEQYAPNYFYYVCPDALIKENEVPHYAGLYYYSNCKLKLIKSAKRIHRGKVDISKTTKKMLRLNVQRKYLGGSWMTYRNKESTKEYNKYLKEVEEQRRKNESLFSDININQETTQSYGKEKN